MVHLWRYAFYVYVVLWNMEILIKKCDCGFYMLILTLNY